MKRWFVWTTVLLAVFVLIVQTFADTRDEEPTETASKRRRPVATEQEDVPRSIRARPPRGKYDANSLTADLEFLEDPNAIHDKVKKFEGLEAEIEAVTKEGDKEVRQWLRGPMEERLALVRSVHKQVLDELAFVRELALKEGAEKTAAAIEALLLDRKDRAGRVLERTEAAIRKMRTGGRDLRDRRDRFRDPRGRGYPDQGTYQDRDRYRGDRDEDRTR